MRHAPRSALSLPVGCLLLVSCSAAPQPAPECPPTATEKLALAPNGKHAVKAPAPRGTPAQAAAFIKETEAEGLRLTVERERASWVKSTYITYDTELIAARAEEAVMEFVSRKAAEATRFDGLALPEDQRRKLMLLKLSTPLPAPQNAARRTELAAIATRMDSLYGKGKVCSPRHKGKCLALTDITEILAKSRDHEEQLELWQGWHAIAKPMRKDFQRFVTLANEGARELGFANLGDLWKSGYDMSPAAFEVEVDRLWDQVKPLYQDLHCYVRGKLQEKYGKQRVPGAGPLPAHLLGNMWAQEWSNLFDFLQPKKDTSPTLDKALEAKQVDERQMVRYGEGFFVSLGLTKLPPSFWERSMFTKPADREVMCHASAWDIDADEDLRIKMCIKITEEDFTTIHHELGHNYYQHYCRKLAPLFRDSANDGFHEALGDTIALSVTPSYLVKVGLLDKMPAAASLNPLMNRALEKIAFLPFGLVVDKWRWDVFAGKTKPGEYNKRWWELRRRYQGVAPTAARDESFFDPGAKYHIPANVPYTRYFLAAILQFQFHRALCRVVGHKGPLHTCSIYGNKEAGKRLRAMMEMGRARPWPEALKALTGEEKMDASAMLAYFQPLHEWLRARNKGRRCGW